MKLPTFSRLTLACLLAFSSATALAEDDVAGPTFEIRNYKFAGNTLLPNEEVERILSRHTSKTASFETIQLAVGALEARYVEQGFGAVKVVLPEQDIEDGIVQLHVVEGHVGQIIVEGNKYYSTENVRDSLPALREGAQPNMRDIDASLRVANENQAKQTALIFRQGAKPGEVDAYIRVADENPLRFAMSLDNSGSPGNDGKYSTGRFRTGFIIQHSNVLDKDHALSFQYLTSPDHLTKVNIIGVGYRVPLYRPGDALEFSFGYSNVDSGKITTAAGPIGISGSGQTYSFKYDHFLPKLGDWQQKLVYGLDYRLFTNSVKIDGANESLVPDSTIHPFSLNYSGSQRFEASEVGASLTYVHNIPGGSDGRTADFRKPGGRVDSTANYQLWRYSFNMTRLLPADWSTKFSFSGQYTRDALISGELFGVGGTDSVRGFFEREVSNDKGYRSSVELHTPELSGFLGLTDMRLRALAFYDLGRLQRNKPQPGELVTETISSAGLGLRWTIGRSLMIRLDGGVVTNAGGNRQTGDKRLHGSIIAFF